MEVLDLARGASSSVANTVVGAASQALDSLSPWAARAPAAAASAAPFRPLAGASRAAPSRRGTSTRDDEQTQHHAAAKHVAAQLRRGVQLGLAAGAGVALGAGMALGARLLRRALLEAALCATCTALEAEAEADALDFFLDLGALRALLRHGRLHAGEGADNAAHFASGIVVVRAAAAPPAKGAAAALQGAAEAAAAAASAAGADAFIHVLRDRLQRRLGPRFQVAVEATSAEVSGSPYRWLRVRHRGVPAAVAAVDVYLGELVPPRGHVSATPPSGLVALFSTASHAPAAAALPSRRALGAGALACPACAAHGKVHALRAPADAEAMMRARFGAQWRGGAAALRAEPACRAAPKLLLAVGGAAGHLARALGFTAV